MSKNIGVSTPFLRTLAKFLRAAAPNQEERDELYNRLMSAHMRTSTERKHTMFDIFSPKTRKWLEPEVKKVTEEYRRKYPHESVVNFWDPREQGSIQTLANDVNNLDHQEVELKLKQKNEGRGWFGIG